LQFVGGGQDQELPRARAPVEEKTPATPPSHPARAPVEEKTPARPPAHPARAPLRRFQRHHTYATDSPSTLLFYLFPFLFSRCNFFIVSSFSRFRTA
jgi:hypothetical protein